MDSANASKYMQTVQDLINESPHITSNFTQEGNALEAVLAYDHLIIQVHTGLEISTVERKRLKNPDLKWPVQFTNIHVVDTTSIAL